MKDYYNTRDSYKTYKKVSKEPIPITTYINILNDFMKFLANKILTKGEARLPSKLGIVKIIGRKIKPRMEDGKIKGLAPDWKATKDLWERDLEAKKSKQVVYHFNEATDGIRYKFLWSKENVLVTNKSLYDIRMTRENKREVPKRIKEGQEYITIN